MADWLADTLLYTGLLLALVLLLRRPAARLFGPQMAYALWALPLLRLFLPPLTLPAWLGPPQAEDTAPAMVIDVAATVSALPVEAASGLALADVALSLWLGGALAFLLWRMIGYVAMRRALLNGACEVGNFATIRFVETPAVRSPVAFGVSDKVIALPVGFMMQLDHRGRNFALMHELEHHRGGDLLANIVAQPLLAMHWWNPVAWLAWQAMRRDQEAACDARVMAGCDTGTRADYGRVIAGFAKGQSHASALSLAAPMACPILGEKSIIHRLRSLSMSDISKPRRMAGRAALALAVLALPLSATISYAQDTPAEQEVAAPDNAKTRHVIIKRDVQGEDGEQAVTEDVRVFVVRSDDAAAPDAESQVHVWHSKDGNESIEIMTDGKDTQRFEFHGPDGVHQGKGFAFAGDCEGNQTKTVEEEISEDGKVIKREFVFCHSQMMADVREALVKARKTIANDKNLPDETRAEILRELDGELADLDHEG